MRQRTIATDRCGHLIQTVEQISNKLGATKHLTLNPPRYTIAFSTNKRHRELV